MRRFVWQRWTLIFLLMARLVIGELGHAMPVAAMAPIEHAAAAMVTEAACPEHEGSGKQQTMVHHGDAADPAAAHSDGDHDCCKSGDCECPCLHAPCVAIDAALANPVSIALLRIPHGAQTVPAARPSGLFRPPA